MFTLASNLLVPLRLQLQAAGARGPATELAEALAQEASAAAEAAAYAAELLAQGRAVEQLREASGVGRWCFGPTRCPNPERAQAQKRLLP